MRWEGGRWDAWYGRPIRLPLCSASLGSGGGSGAGTLFHSTRWPYPRRRRRGLFRGECPGLLSDRSRMVDFRGLAKSIRSHVFPTGEFAPLQIVIRRVGTVGTTIVQIGSFKRGVQGCGCCSSRFDLVAFPVVLEYSVLFVHTSCP